MRESIRGTLTLTLTLSLARERETEMLEGGGGAFWIGEEYR